MKYPVTLNIRGYTYRIEYVQTPREVDQDFEVEYYLGTCNAHVIRILATQPQISLLDSVVHEILHAIFTRNRMLRKALKANMEESFVATLAGEIAEILLDNELVKFPKQRPPITTRINPETNQ
jgi:hypothetical protein